jgi:hypothetical protein
MMRAALHSLCTYGVGLGGAAAASEPNPCGLVTRQGQLIAYGCCAAWYCLHIGSSGAIASLKACQCYLCPLL